jgi:hypothetical protein
MTVPQEEKEEKQSDIDKPRNNDTDDAGLVNKEEFEKFRQEVLVVPKK